MSVSLSDHSVTKILILHSRIVDCGVTTIICGGDTVSAVEEKGNINFTHISTGGGASLEVPEGKTLPGIRILNEISDLRQLKGMDETKKIMGIDSARDGIIGGGYSGHVCALLIFFRVFTDNSLYW